MKSSSWQKVSHDNTKFVMTNKSNKKKNKNAALFLSFHKTAFKHIRQRSLPITMSAPSRYK